MLFFYNFIYQTRKLCYLTLNKICGKYHGIDDCLNMLKLREEEIP